ncbi:MAG: leucine-rich repeat domain-containing protein, partial [Clostridiales bacterium]|nr:leucine-rich repeat domain-containing protein [Clostridiales bacterium]
NAFLSARNLDTITVEEGNTVYSAENNVLYETYPGIPNGVLAKVANHITAVTIPERVKRISSFAFSYCDKLKSVTIPETLGGYNNAQGLTPSAFENCLSLESIVIEPVLEGSGVIGRVMDTLPNSVFAGCKNLKSLSYPAAVASIDAAAFRDCAKLESIYISDKVVSVGFYCFSGCASLTIRCGYAYAGGDIPKPNQWRPYTYWSDTWNSDDRPVVWGAQA